MINLFCGAILALSFLLTLSPERSLADERCKQLEALRAQYVGVTLTADQKVLKLKLVAWYSANCGKHEVADVKSAAATNFVR